MCGPLSSQVVSYTVWKGAHIGFNMFLTYTKLTKYYPAIFKNKCIPVRFRYK